MADFGILIGNGKDDVTAQKGANILLSSKQPFAKLDSSKATSLQNITLTFRHDPPNPDGVTVFEQDTAVYSFSHTYTYIPTVWLLFQRLVGLAVQTGPGLTRDIPYGYEGSAIALSTTSDAAPFASLDLKVDKEKVYLIVHKSYDTRATLDAAVDITGYVLHIRAYVFVEDMGF